ncbi:MAG: hypothetical protein EOO75_13610 [Myxococcales bacterium]|nr:MAG: hypothetical protein EOO75_13610 [Myxococcales bacterium]
MCRPSTKPRLAHSSRLDAVSFLGGSTAAALAPAPAPVEPPRNDTASSRLECASLGFVDGLHTDRFRGITYIDRATVDRLIEPHNALTRSSRLVPEQSHGRTVGVRLFGIRPDTILGRLGFANGDLLRTINGLDVASPERTLEAYAKLREASVFLVLVERQGVPRLLEFRLC